MSKYADHRIDKSGDNEVPSFTKEEFEKMLDNVINLKVWNPESYFHILEEAFTRLCEEERKKKK
jgi:hypothetical protein